MALVQLLTPISGYAGRQHAIGEVLVLPETHPLVLSGMAIVMGAGAETFLCEHCKLEPAAMFASEKLLEEHQRIVGCGNIEAAPRLRRGAKPSGVVADFSAEQ